MLVLHRHFGGAFHGNASRVCEENLVQAIRQKFYKALAEFNGGLVGETAEHHVTHLFALLLNRFDNFGSVVPVSQSPPAGYGVNEF